MAEARRVVLPSFVLTQTCECSDSDAIQRKIPSDNGEIAYCYKPVSVPIIRTYS